LILQPTRELPIVFVAVTDPVGAGLAKSMGRPGRNTAEVYWLRVRHERQSGWNRAPRQEEGDPAGRSCDCANAAGTLVWERTRNGDGGRNAGNRGPGGIIRPARLRRAQRSTSDET